MGQSAAIGVVNGIASSVEAPAMRRRTGAETWRLIAHLGTAVLAVACFALPLAAAAQSAGKVFQIGYLGNSTPSVEAALVEGFRQGLRENGYFEGKDVVVHYRWADGRIDTFPVLAAELVRLKVDVIVASGTPGSLAAQRATKTIPIVVAAVGDAVGVGLVPSLARPGGNVTGLSALTSELEGKRLEVLSELVPKVGVVSVLMNPANPFTALAWKETQAAGAKLRLTLHPAEVRTVDAFDAVFAAIVKTRPDALVVIADRFLLSNRKRIVAFAAQHRLPAMYPFREFADEGGLVVYGPNFADMFRRAGRYIDRILKGTNPGDLPMEQPTRFELVINGKTAKTLGLTIPPSLLLQADRVIE
jgi:putative ABC transport system substrate-binding protein